MAKLTKISYIAENKHQMNFVWLDINASWSHSSLALPALHANLTAETAQMCNMQVVRGTIKSNISEILAELQAQNPTYIFATAWLFNTNYLREILTRINEISHPKGIFLGGPEFLGNNEFFLKSNPHVTAVFKGEGEDMFEQFITSLLNNNENWRTIEGFEWVKDGVYHTSKAITVDDFPSLNYPDNSPLFNWDKSFVQLETSRGCFNTCRFCVSGIEKCAIKNISIEELRKRLDNIARHGIKQVRVLDRTFNANPKRGVELLNLFKEYSGKINFHLEVHPALLRSPFKEAIAEVPQGLLHIEAGIQTLRQDVLDNCTRLGSCAEATQGIKYLIGTGKFEVHADLISGLPGYTYKDLVEDTLQLMLIAPAEIQLESLKLLPGTYFRERCADFGIRFSPLPPYEVLETPQISYREISKSMVLSKILDLWYNDGCWRDTFREIFTKNDGLLEALIEELDGTEIMNQPISAESKGLLLYKFCKQYAPQTLNSITINWVKNGYSLKKEPAQDLQKWDIKSEMPNPIFVEKEHNYKYYYLQTASATYWFAFNAEIKRVGPCKLEIIH